MFQRYQHLEKLGTQSVEGLLDGECHIFPKIDGTNGSIWFDEFNNCIQCGSRNRQLSVIDDNQGFAQHAVSDERYSRYLNVNRDHVLYGEWLVSHTLKTYREDAWKKFYVFDIFDRGMQRYVTYEEYQPQLDGYEIDYIPCYWILDYPKDEDIVARLELNDYLIKDGQGVGEGLVIKRYGYTNPFGKTVWGKKVRSEFKEKHVKTTSPTQPELGGLEHKIVEDFLDYEVIDKCLARIDGWESRKIAQLLGLVWHDFVTEEIWEILKKRKNPTIDFKQLKRMCDRRVKEMKPELFN